MRGNNKLPSVHFGAPSKKPADWRKSNMHPVDERDDDRLRKTPASVKRMLGFDPAAKKIRKGKK